MQIKTIIERDDKSFEFVAELTERQHAYLINFAISTLMERGMIPEPSMVEDQPKGEIH